MPANVTPRRESTGLIGRCSRSTSAQAVRLSGRSRIKPIGILFFTRLPADFRVVRKWSTHVSPGMRLSIFSQPRCRLCAIVSLLETALRSDSRTFRGLSEAMGGRIHLFDAGDFIRQHVAASESSTELVHLSGGWEDVDGTEPCLDK